MGTVKRLKAKIHMLTKKPYLCFSQKSQTYVTIGTHKELFTGKTNEEHLDHLDEVLPVCMCMRRLDTKIDYSSGAVFLLFIESGLR